MKAPLRRCASPAGARWRIGLILTVPLAVWAVDGPLAIDHSLIRIEAGHVFVRVEPEGDDPHLEQRNGFRGGYEQVALRSDHNLIWLQPLLSGSRAWLSRARFEPGERGPEPGRIHLDTRNAQLDGLPYRGLLRPERMYVERMPWPGVADGQASASAPAAIYRIQLLGVGWSYGLIQMQSHGGLPSAAGRREAEGSSTAPRWVPIVSWTERLELEVACQVDAQGDLSEPVLRRIDILGPTLGESLAEVALYDGQTPFRMQGRRFHLHFGRGPDGRTRLVSTETGGDGNGRFAYQGLPRGTPAPLPDPLGRLLLPPPVALPRSERFDGLLAPTPEVPPPAATGATQIGN